MSRAGLSPTSKGTRHERIPIHGKVAAITGAASGIGLECARALLERKA